MKKYPVVMTIAGSDSGGGAGIQADLKTISALGAFGTTVITAVTAQNTMGVQAVFPVSNRIIEKQFESIISDINVTAIKTGMLPSISIIHSIAKCINNSKIENFVLDPVMVATSGDKLIEEETIDELVYHLFPLAKVITPNIIEAEIILNRKIASLDCMKKAAKALLDTKCKSVLLKGGHLDFEGIIYDIYQKSVDEEPIVISSRRIETNNVHGTGCTLSAAIATYLALGKTIEEAVIIGRNYVISAIEAGKNYKLGSGNGPLNHSFNPEAMLHIQ